MRERAGRIANRLREELNLIPSRLLRSGFNSFYQQADEASFLVVNVRGARSKEGCQRVFRAVDGADLREKLRRLAPRVPFGGVTIFTLLDERGTILDSTVFDLRLSRP